MENTLHHKLISFLLLCAVTLLGQDTKPNSVTAGQPPHPDFSGTWKLNMGLSRFSQGQGPQPGYAPVHNETDVIDYEEPVMAISPHIDRRDVIYTLFCRTDGKGPQGPYADRQQRCDAHWEGATYVYDTRPKTVGGTSEHTVMELSPDGKTLTKRSHVTLPEGPEDRLFVFDKISDVRGGIAIGDTIERVKRQWGEPETIIAEGKQTILIYGGMDQVFIDGKMVDGVGGTGIGNRPPVYPDDIAIGQTKNQVLKTYDQPAKAVQVNGKEIDFYKFLVVAYLDGKVMYISATGQTKDEVLAVFGQPTRTVQWNGKEFGFYPFMTATYFNNRLINIGPSSY
jgi:hypothetical protein